MPRASVGTLRLCKLLLTSLAQLFVLCDHVLAFGVLEYTFVHEAESLVKNIFSVTAISCFHCRPPSYKSINVVLYALLGLCMSLRKCYIRTISKMNFILNTVNFETDERISCPNFQSAVNLALKIELQLAIFQLLPLYLIKTCVSEFSGTTFRFWITAASISSLINSTMSRHNSLL